MDSLWLAASAPPNLVEFSHAEQTSTIAAIGAATDDLPKLCTRAETAALFRKDLRTIDRWIARGFLRAIRPAGGYPLIPRTEIERLLLEGAQ